MGKTTSVINIAAALGNLGKKVLVVDCDPQGNSSSGLGFNKSRPGITTYDLIIGRSDARSAIIKTQYKNLYLIPTAISLAGAEIELIDTEKREAKLRSSLEKVRGDYDYILLDCPPSLGLLTINALVASDGVVIPMQCEFFALEGLSQIMLSIRQIKKLYNPSVTLTGILITMYNGRLNLSLQVLDELKKYYAAELFTTVIPRSVRISEAPSFGQPIQYYDKFSKGGSAYDEVAKELTERI